MAHRTFWRRSTLGAAILGLALSGWVLAQEAGQTTEPNSSPSQTESPATPPKQVSAPKPEQPAQTSQPPKNDRLFFALPNYPTVESASSLPALTSAQKFKLTADGTFDPMEFVFVGIQAGIGQARDSNASFGQGFDGYGKRYAVTYADACIEDFMAHAVFPSLLRQDPRYYQLGKGGFFQRFAHAAGQVVITRSDAGATQINFSEILGSGSAAAISNLYHPGPHTFGKSADEWGTQVAWDIFGFEMKELWPDIHRLIKHGKKPV